MAVLKNVGHEKFAQEIAKGRGQMEAYGLAGFKGTEQNACRLAANPKVRARVIELQERGAVRAEVSVASLIEEAHEIQMRALGDGVYAAAVSALTAKAKLAGKWVERSEQGKPGDFDRMSEAELESFIAERFAGAGGSDTGARTQAGQTGMRGKPSGLH